MAAGGNETHTGNAEEPSTAQNHPGALGQLLNFLHNLGSSRAERATASDDVIESLLKDMTFNNLGWIQNSRFLRIDYERLKDRPAERHRVVKNQQPPISIYSCHQLMCHWNFKPPDPGNRNPMTGREAWTTISTQDSFSDWACHIVSDLQNPTPDGLQLLTFAEQPSPKDINLLFSFWHKTLASVQGRIEGLSLLPTTLLLVIIKQVCNLDLLSYSPHDLGHDAEAITRPVLIIPPSLQKLNSIQTQEESTGIKWSLASMIPRAVDLGRGNNEILLTWLPQATRYTSDLRVYIWENYKSFPILEYAKIVLRSSRPDLEPDQMTVAFRSCSTNVAFALKRTSLSLQRDLETAETIGNPRWLSSCECFLSFQCVYELIIDDVTNFINMYRAEIYQMNKSSRKSPSTSKMRFLMHSEECLKVTHNGVKHSIDILGIIESSVRRLQTDPVRIWDGGIPFQNRHKKLREDLEYLDSQLEELKGATTEIKELLRQHFQLTQDMRLYRLTMLAAIFLPLSFTTSFFGMNIHTDVSEGPSGFSDWTKDALAAVAEDQRNATEAIISIIGTSGNLSFRWLVFGVTAGCLLLTLPLTLMLGYLMRAFVKWTAKLATYWLIFVIFGGYAFFVYTVTGFMINIPFWLTCNAIVMVAALWKVYVNWKSKQKPLVWAAFLLLYLASVLLTCFVTSVMPMLLPWSFLIAALTQGFWKKYSRDMGRLLRGN